MRMPIELLATVATMLSVALRDLIRLLVAMATIVSMAAKAQIPLSAGSAMMAITLITSVI